MDVLLVPVEGGDADARRALLRGRALFEPGSEIVDRGPGGVAERDEIGVGRGQAAGEVEQVGALGPFLAGPEAPEVGRVLDEVRPGLGQYGRYRRELFAQEGPAAFIGREGQLPEVQDAVDLGALAKRDIGFGRLDDGVEAGDPRPGPEDPVVELEPVHLGPDDLVVDAPVDGPGGGIDGGQAVLEGLEAAPLDGHGRGCVVGHAAGDARLLELAEILPERQEALVGPAGGSGRRGGGLAPAGREPERQSGQKGCRDQPRCAPPCRHVRPPSSLFR